MLSALSAMSYPSDEPMDTECMGRDIELASASTYQVWIYRCGRKSGITENRDTITRWGNNMKCFTHGGRVARLPVQKRLQYDFRILSMCK